ncbi:hypothetical protein GLOIN_2v1484099 [Rhizophagus clarus]|uniref:Uncharacterized protein n=1 Tax=Rhizophagus clarus TaxID=94130 RepID=A0A8H3KYD5_9GLOM|nr:hypothetical protein GLOIN_2v1484099 [Rhizophagus clarus]
MEYGIYFNNDSENNAILSALKELKNTFFAENSSCESEKNTTNDDENTSDEEITFMDKNFENLHLNNFEFIENTDNYIENKVYNDLKLKVKKTEFESLDKTMWNMIIKDQLIAFEKDEGRTKNKNIHASIIVLIIIFQYAEHSLGEHIYDNTGNTSKNMNRIKINYSLAYKIHEFLKNYANMHGIPSPGQKFFKFTMPIIFLLTNFSYVSVYRDYVQTYKDEHESEIQIIYKTTFINI